MQEIAILLAAVIASANATTAVLVIASLTAVGGLWYASCATSPKRRAHAVGTGIAGGTGAASAIAGAVTQHGGSAKPAFAVAALAVAGATILASAGRAKLRASRLQEA